MKTERTYKKQGLRRLIACLVVTLMLLGVAPVYAEESLLPSVGPLSGTVTVQIGTEGFGSADGILGLLNIMLAFDSEKKAADLNVSLLGKSIGIIAGWGADGVRFTIPALGSDVYGIGEDFIKELTGAFGAKLPIGQEGIKLPDVQKLFTDIFELAFSYMTPETLTAAEGTYTYILLPDEDSGTVCTWMLNKEQWKEYMTKSVQLVSENSELVAFIAQIAGKTEDELKQMLSLDEAKLDETAGNLAECSFSLFIAADGTLRALSFGNDPQGILYEAQGSVTDGGRTAAIAVKNAGSYETLLTNQMAMDNSGFFGKLDIAGKDISLAYSLEGAENNGIRLTLALSSGEQTVSLAILYTAGTADITVPGKATKTINSTNDLLSLAQGLVGVVYSLLGA